MKKRMAASAATGAVSRCGFDSGCSISSRSVRATRTTTKRSVSCFLQQEQQELLLLIKSIVSQTPVPTKLVNALLSSSSLTTSFSQHTDLYLMQQLNSQTKRWFTTGATRTTVSAAAAAAEQQEQDLKRETDELMEIASGRKSQNHTTTRTMKTKAMNDYNRVLHAWTERAAMGGDEGFAAAQEAHRMLQVLYENMKRKKNSEFITADAITYTKVMHAYSISKSGRRGAQRAQSILMQMLHDCQNYTTLYFNPQQQQQTFPFRPPEPDEIAFNCVIQAWARSGQNDAGHRAHEVILTIHDWNTTCNNARRKNKAFPYQGCCPDTRTLAATIAALSHDTKRGPEKALEIVMSLIDAAAKESTSGDPPRKTSLLVQVNTHVFNVLMDVWVKSGRGSQAAEKVEQIFELMYKVNIQPDIVTYGTLLDAWARAEAVTGSGVFAQKADDLLRKMIDSYRNKGEGKGNNNIIIVKPNVTCFNSVIAAWSRCKSNNNRDSPTPAERAESLYQSMMELYHETGDSCDKEFLPTVQTGNAIITVLARALQLDDSMARARRVLESMEEQQHQQQQPDLITYNALLDGYAKRGMGEEARHLLVRLLRKDIQSNSHSHLRPNIITYNSVLNALAREERPDCAERAQKLLDQMESDAKAGKGGGVQPDFISYTTVINAWSRAVGMRQKGSRGQVKAAEQAETVLNRMIEQFQHTGNNTIKPNVTSFNTCITSWSRCDYPYPTAPENAQRIYDKLIRLFERTGDPDLKPNVITVNAIITAWSRAVRHTQSMNRAVQIFQECGKYTFPDTITYSTILDGYAKRGMADEACELLNFMKRQSEQKNTTTSTATAEVKPKGNLKPNVRSYTSVLNALAKNRNKQINAVSESAIRANELLEEMKAKGQRDSELKPNNISYQCVISAWSKLPASNAQRFERAEALMREMIVAAGGANGDKSDKDMKPQASFLIFFLKSFSGQSKQSSSEEHNANAQQQHKHNNEKALVDICFDAFALLKYHDIDQREYVNYIQTVNERVNCFDSRRRLFEQVFRHACEGGTLSPPILAALQKCTPNVVVVVVPPSPLHGTTTETLGDPKWSRNVGRRKQR